jgi:phosphoserine / homoserine phosphotransferase
MKLVCLDMENVFWGEIWMEVAEATGVEGFKYTTRDFPDITELFAMRQKLMDECGLKLSQVLECVEKMEPLPGSVDFLREVEKIAQVVVLSDTFEQFIPPIRKALGYPTFICNTLDIAEDGRIVNWHMRCKESKLSTVRAFQTVGIEVIAAGDSYNDLGMIQEAHAGFLINASEKLRGEYPYIPAFDNYDDLLDAIKIALKN